MPRFSWNCLFTGARCSASAVTRRISYLYDRCVRRAWALAGEEVNGFTGWLWGGRLRQTHSCKKPEREQMWASLPMVDFRGSLIFLRKGSEYWPALCKDGLVKQNWGENDLNPNFLFLSFCQLFGPFSVALQVFFVCVTPHAVGFTLLESVNKIFDSKGRPVLCSFLALVVSRACRQHCCSLPSTRLVFFPFLMLANEQQGHEHQEKPSFSFLLYVLFTPSPYTLVAEKASHSVCGHGLTCGQISVCRLWASSEICCGLSSLWLRYFRVTTSWYYSFYLCVMATG